MKALKITVMAVGAFGMLFTGCINESSDSAQESQLIKVDTETFSPVEDFFTDSKYVILETSDSCVLDGETIFHTSDDYIVAYSEAVGFSVFDMNGKNVSNFSFRGEGPGEYVEISDYCISGDEIYCMARAQNKIISYNFLKGKLVNEISLKDSYIYLSPLKSSTVVVSPAYTNDSGYNFSILDGKNGEIKKEYLPYETPKSYIFGDFTAFVGKSKKCVYGVLPYDYKLYRISEKECDVMFEYEFNTPDQLPAVDSKDINIAQLSEDYKYKRVVKWLGLFADVSDDVKYQNFSLMCNYGILPFLCKINAKDGTVKTLQIGAKRFDTFPYLTGAPFEFRDGWYVCSSAAMSVLGAEKSLGETTFSSKGLTESSNPVIFFYKFKKD